MKRFISFFSALLVMLCVTNASAQDFEYARAPRFKALFYYSMNVELAHQQFAQGTLDFFKGLTVGDGWSMESTQNLADYPYERLKEFDIVVFINDAPTDPKVRADFQKYMENGGGWLGFHAAAYNDASTKWPWYNEFLGCGKFLCNQWPPQPALLTVETTVHPVTKNLPVEFVSAPSEFYMWQENPRDKDNVEVLVSISPKNYPFGIKDVVYSGDFPIAWTNKNFRMLYINWGHGDDEYMESTQNLMAVNAFRWILSRSPKGNPFAKYTK